MLIDPYELSKAFVKCKRSFLNRKRDNLFKKPDSQLSKISEIKTLNLDQNHTKCIALSTKTYKFINIEKTSQHIAQETPLIVSKSLPRISSSFKFIKSLSHTSIFKGQTSPMNKTAQFKGLPNKTLSIRSKLLSKSFSKLSESSNAKDICILKPSLTKWATKGMSINTTGHDISARVQYMLNMERNKAGLPNR